MSEQYSPSGYILAGVDDGFADTKVVTQDRKVRVASCARAGLHGLSSVSIVDDNVSASYETAGRNFTIGDFIDGEETRFDDYPTSDLNRVVVHHALRLAGLSGQRVKIASGLPVDMYFKGSVRNENAIRAKQEALMKRVTVSDGGETAEIVEHVVLPEAVASWFDYAFDEEGKEIEMDGPCGVIDIGGKTTDCVTILPGHQIDHLRSGTGNIGVLDIYEQIGAHLRAQFGEGVISRRVFDRAVRTGTIKRFGREVSVQAAVTTAIDDVSERVLREAKRHFGSAADLDVILFVGGGAALMTKLSSYFPNARVQPEPEFANARGMYKYLRLNG